MKGRVPQERKITEFSGGAVTSITHPLVLREYPIAWGIPMDEIMYSKFFELWNRNLNIMPWDEHIVAQSTYLPIARNLIHDRYLEGSKAPYLMMLDSDVICPPNLVEKLLDHKLPIVGGWYKNKNMNYPPHPVVYDFVSESDSGINFKHRDAPGTGLEKVDGMGAGCWLMSREVAEKLGKSPYAVNKATEDLLISKKLMDLGIPLYVDWSLNCAHLGVQIV